MTLKEQWYAIRTAPGSQRMARPLPVPEKETEEEKAERQRRVGESTIERNLRNEGVDVYMPSYWHESFHHRTNKTIERRLPLMVGYAFVHLPDLEFEKVRCVEGVIGILRGSREFGPVRFRVEDIGKIAHEEHARRQSFRREQVLRIEKANSNKQMEIRGNLRKILKKGRSTRVNLKEQAMVAIESMEHSARDKVLGMLKELDQLDVMNDLAIIDRVA